MYEQWVQRMSAAKTNPEKKAAVEDMCRMFAFSTSKAYRILKENGYDTGRAQRKDAGATVVDRQLLEEIAEMCRQSIRKNGKATLPIPVVRSILIGRGINIPVGDSRLRELLRQARLSVRDAKKPEPHQPMRTEYPNQVHFADPSVCLLYFTPGGR